jgi:hypothetical protein
MQGMGLFAVIRVDSKVAITVPHRDYINYVRLDRVDRRPKRKNEHARLHRSFHASPEKNWKKSEFPNGAYVINAGERATPPLQEVDLRCCSSCAVAESCRRTNRLISRDRSSMEEGIREMEEKDGRPKKLGPPLDRIVPTKSL